jgi:hypothetical protein
MRKKTLAGNSIGKETYDKIEEISSSDRMKKLADNTSRSNSRKEKVQIKELQQ